MDGATRPSPPRLSKSSVVVGAGVTGLVCARALLEAGLSVVVVEAAPDLFPGPAAERFSADLVKTYPDLGKLFSLPEYKPPDGASPDDLQRYLLSYVEHFRLRQHIIFSCKLEHAQVGDDGLWCIVCSDLLDPQRLHRLTADFLVISSGACLAPALPQLPASAEFFGLRCHARDLRSREAESLLSGQHVVVVGDDRAAVDSARRAAAAGAASVTLLYRQPHWPLPRRLAGLPLPHLAYTRCLPGLLFPPYYTASGTSRLLSAALGPLRRLYWWRQERALAGRFGLGGGLRPPVDLMRDMFYGVQASGELDNWLGVLRGTSVRLVRGDISRLGPDTVVLKDGTSLPAGVLVHCTPCTRSYTVFDPELQASLGVRKDGLHLYRSLLPPEVPSLAFLGCDTSSPYSWLTTSLQAHWLAAVASGRLALPGTRAMKADVYQQRRWRRRAFPPQHNRGSLIQWYAQAYHDQLLGDMGISTSRIKALSSCLPLCTACAAYNPQDYRPLFTTVHSRPAMPYSRHTTRNSIDVSAVGAEIMPRRGVSVTAAAAGGSPSHHSHRPQNETHRTSMDCHRSQDFAQRLSMDVASRAALTQVSVTRNVSRLQLLLHSRTSCNPPGDITDTDGGGTAAAATVAANADGADFMSSAQSLSIPVTPLGAGTATAAAAVGSGSVSSGPVGCFVGLPPSRPASIACSRLAGTSLRGTSMSSLISAATTPAGAAVLSATGGTSRALHINPSTAGIAAAAAVVASGGATSSTRYLHATSIVGGASIVQLSGSLAIAGSSAASHPEIKPDEAVGLMTRDGAIAAAIAAAAMAVRAVEDRVAAAGTVLTATGYGMQLTAPEANVGTGMGTGPSVRMISSSAGGAVAATGTEAVPSAKHENDWRVAAAAAAAAPPLSRSKPPVLPLSVTRRMTLGAETPTAASTGGVSTGALSLGGEDIRRVGSAMCSLADRPPNTHTHHPAAGPSDPWDSSPPYTGSVANSIAAMDADSTAAVSAGQGLPYSRAVATTGPAPNLPSPLSVAGPVTSGSSGQVPVGSTLPAGRFSASASGRTGSTGQWPSSSYNLRTAAASAVCTGIGSIGGSVQPVADYFSSNGSSGGVRHRDISTFLPPSMLHGYEVLSPGDLISRCSGSIAAAAVASAAAHRHASPEPALRLRVGVDGDADGVGSRGASLSPRVRRSLDGDPLSDRRAPAGVSAADAAGSNSSGGGSGQALLVTSTPRTNPSPGALLLAAARSSLVSRGSASRSGSGLRSLIGGIHRPSQLGVRQMLQSPATGSTPAVAAAAAAPAAGGPCGLPSYTSDAIVDLLDTTRSRGGLVPYPPSNSNSMVLLVNDRPSPAISSTTNAVAGSIGAGGGGAGGGGGVPHLSHTGVPHIAVARAAAATLASPSGAGGAGGGSGSLPRAQLSAGAATSSSLSTAPSGPTRKGRRSSAVAFSSVLANDDFLQLLLAAGNNDGRPEGIIDVCESKSALAAASAPPGEDLQAAGPLPPSLPTPIPVPTRSRHTSQTGHPPVVGSNIGLRNSPGRLRVRHAAGGFVAALAALSQRRPSGDLNGVSARSSTTRERASMSGGVPSIHRRSRPGYAAAGGGGGEAGGASGSAGSGLRHYRRMASFSRGGYATTGGYITSAASTSAMDPAWTSSVVGGGMEAQSGKHGAASPAVSATATAGDAAAAAAEVTGGATASGAAPNTMGLRPSRSVDALAPNYGQEPPLAAVSQYGTSGWFLAVPEHEEEGALAASQGGGGGGQRSAAARSRGGSQSRHDASGSGGLGGFGDGEAAGDGRRTNGSLSLLLDGSASLAASLGAAIATLTASRRPDRDSGVDILGSRHLGTMSLAGALSTFHAAPPTTRADLPPAEAPPGPQQGGGQKGAPVVPGGPATARLGSCPAGLLHDSQGRSSNGSGATTTMSYITGGRRAMAASAVGIGAATEDAVGGGVDGPGGPLPGLALLATSNRSVVGRGDLRRNISKHALVRGWNHLKAALRRKGNGSRYSMDVSAMAPASGSGADGATIHTSTSASGGGGGSPHLPQERPRAPYAASPLYSTASRLGAIPGLDHLGLGVARACTLGEQGIGSLSGMTMGPYNDTLVRGELAVTTRSQSYCLPRGAGGDAGGQSGSGADTGAGSEGDGGVGIFGSGLSGGGGPVSPMQLAMLGSGGGDSHGSTASPRNSTAAGHTISTGSGGAGTVTAVAAAVVAAHQRRRSALGMSGTGTLSRLNSSLGVAGSYRGGSSFGMRTEVVEGPYDLDVMGSPGGSSCTKPGFVAVSPAPGVAGLAGGLAVACADEEGGVAAAGPSAGGAGGGNGGGNGGGAGSAGSTMPGLAGPMGVQVNRRVPVRPPRAAVRQGSSLALAVDAAAAVLAAAAGAVPRIVSRLPSFSHSQGAQSSSSNTNANVPGCTISCSPPQVGPLTAASTTTTIGMYGSSGASGPRVVHRSSTLLTINPTSLQTPPVLVSRLASDEALERPRQPAGGPAASTRCTLATGGGSMRHMPSAATLVQQPPHYQPNHNQQPHPQQLEGSSHRSRSAHGYHGGEGSSAGTSARAGSSREAGGGVPYDVYGNVQYMTDSFESPFIGHALSPRPRAPPRRRESLLRTLLNPGSSLTAAAAAVPTLQAVASSTVRAVRRLPKRVASELPLSSQRVGGMGAVMDSFARKASKGGGGGDSSGRGDGSVSPPPASRTPSIAVTLQYGSVSSVALNSPSPTTTATVAGTYAATATGSTANSCSNSAVIGAGGGVRSARRRPVPRRDSVIGSLLAEMAEDGDVMGELPAMRVHHSSGFAGISGLGGGPSTVGLSGGFDPHAPEGVLAWERPRGWDQQGGSEAGTVVEEELDGRRPGVLRDSLAGPSRQLAAAAAAAGLPSVILGHGLVALPTTHSPGQAPATQPHDAGSTSPVRADMGAARRPATHGSRVGPWDTQPRLTPTGAPSGRGGPDASPGADH